MKVVSSVHSLLSDGAVWFGGKQAHVLPRAKVKASFGIEEIDLNLLGGGLPLGSLHELSLTSAEKLTSSWYVPLSFISLLLQRLLREYLSQPKNESLPPLVWIGDRILPSPHLLEDFLLPEKESEWHWETHCIFVQALKKRERFLSAIEILRSQAVLAAVIDGTQFDFIATRRLLLAAKRGNVLALLARPSAELTQRSAAQTKWNFTPSPSPNEHPRWCIELLRAPGLLSTKQWQVEWNAYERQKNPLSLLPNVDERSDQLLPEAEPQRQLRG